MSNSLIRRLFDTAAGDVPPDVGATVFPQLNRDEIGVVQVQITVGTATILIQGRLDDSMLWSTLLQVDETDVDSSGTTVQAVRMMKQMRANVVAAAGTPVVRVWLQE